MPITVNEGGVLHELETVTSNEGGVLYEIHSADSFPDSLTWAYTNTSSYPPAVSNNGFTVSNNLTISACGSVKSNTFEIKGKVKIWVKFTMSTSYQGNSGGFSIVNGSTGVSVCGITITTSGAESQTYELETGRYYIIGGSTGGGQSGNGANSYTINVAFLK